MAQPSPAWIATTTEPRGAPTVHSNFSEIALVLHANLLLPPASSCAGFEAKLAVIYAILYFIAINNVTTIIFSVSIVITLINISNNVAIIKDGIKVVREQKNS